MLHDLRVHRIHRVDSLEIGFARSARDLDLVEAHLIARRALQFARLRHPIGQEKFAVGFIEQGHVGSGLWRTVGSRHQQGELSDPQRVRVGAGQLGHDGKVLNAAGDIVEIRGDRHQDHVRRRDGVEAEHPERRRGIHYDQIVTIRHLFQSLAQTLG